MRACVTGATGLIGAALVRRLIADGHEVSALVRSPASETSSSGTSQQALAGVRIVAGDLANHAAVAEAVRGADVVFHLAAKVSDTAPLRDFEGANVEGTTAILEAAAAGSARRVIYLSSIAVYGRVTEDAATIDESTPLDAEPEKRDAYSHSKIAAERAAVASAQRLRLPLTVLRPGIVYGRGRVPPASLVGFSVGRTHVAFAQPGWHFPLVYVENLVDAIVAAAQRQAAAGEPSIEDFNIVDDDALTLAKYHEVRNAAEHSRTVFLSPNPVLAAAAVFGPIAGAITPAASGFSSYQMGRSLQDRIYGTKKIRAAFNWSPRVSLDDALSATFRSRGSQT